MWAEALNQHPTLFEGATWNQPKSEEDREHQIGIRERIIAVRDADLIVALPVEVSELDGEDIYIIRMLNLGAWKRACAKFEHQKDIKTVAAHAASEVHPQELILSLPTNFPIRQLELNQNGRLLAVVGDHDVAVAVLPLYSKFAGQTINVKSYLVGKMHHSFDDITRIVRVQWHPLSDGKCHLMVLSSNGILRMYNLAKNPDDPEQTFPFCDMANHSAHSSPSKLSSPKKTNRSGLFAADVDDFEAVSFDLGRGTGWGPFTVYCMMKSGNIFAACPIVPEQCEISCDYLRGLKASNLYTSRLVKEGDEYAERQFYWRSRWIQDFLNSAEDKAQIRVSESDGIKTRNTNAILDIASDVVALTAPKTTRNLRMLRQGPIRLTKPEVLEGAACDFRIIGDGALTVACLAMSSGHVVLCIDAEELMPRWAVQRERALDDLEPNYVVFEVVDLEANGTSSVLLESDSNNPDVLFACHSKGIHLINIQPWRHYLIESDDSDAAAKDLVDGRKTSELKLLWNITSVASKVSSKVAGLGIISNLFLDYSYVAITERGSIHLEGLASSIVLRGESRLIDLSAVPTQIGGQKNSFVKTPKKAPRKATEIAKYEQSIVETFSMPEAISRNGTTLLKSTQTSKEPFPACVNEESLERLRRGAEPIREELLNLKAAGNELNFRIGDLSEEETKQEAILKGWEAVLEREKRLQEKSVSVKQKQGELLKKLDAVLQILIDASQPQLTKEDEEWFAELRGLSAKVKSHYNPQIRQMQRKKSIVLPDIQRSNEQNLARMGGLSSSQMKRAHEALTVEYRLITDAWKKYSEIQRMMELLKI
ncbi:hypothetical protein HDU97_010076 [Phlyctochytrium planicorne]|nr:hypothetical protein HDU97_010076 [Phlyctochytrium planicorne]